MILKKKKKRMLETERDREISEDTLLQQKTVSPNINGIFLDSKMQKEKKKNLKTQQTSSLSMPVVFSYNKLENQSHQNHFLKGT